MPIAVLCGACDAKLNAPDAAAGKKVKCPKCGNPLVIPMPSDDFGAVDESTPAATKAKPKPVPLDEDDAEDAPPKKPGKKQVVVDDEDQEDEDAPKAKKRGKNKPAANGSALPLLIGGGVLGLALAGFLVYWFVLREPEVAKAPPTNPPAGPVVPGGPQAPSSPARPATPPAGWKLVEHPEFSAWFGEKGKLSNEFFDKSPLPGGFPYTFGTRMVTLEPGKSPDAQPPGLAVLIVPLTESQKAKATTNLGDVFKTVFEREYFRPGTPVVAFKDTTLDGKPAVAWEFSNAQRGTTMHFLGAVAHDRAYLLIAAGPNVTADDDAVKTFRGSFRFGTNVPPVPVGGGNTGPAGPGTNPDSAKKWARTDITANGFPLTLDLPANAKIHIQEDPKRPFLYVNPSLTSTIAVMQAGDSATNAGGWKTRDLEQNAGIKFIEEKPDRYFGGYPDENLGKGMMTYLMCVEVESGGKKYLIHAAVNTRSRQNADFYWATLCAAKAK